MTGTPSTVPARAYWLALATLIAIGVARMPFIWYTLSATYDEPEHIAAGLEWWSGGYSRDLTHPPLTRALVSLGPMLRGATFQHGVTLEQEMRNALYNTGYEDTLASARAPVAIFYVLACVGAFLWGRWLWGPAAGIAAAGLLSLTPVVIGHSALATTDAGIMSFLPLALYGWARFLENPSWLRAAAVGILFGLAAACKLTSFFFFIPAAAILALLARWRKTRPLEGVRWTPLIAVLAIAVLWASYRFERSPLGDIGHYQRDLPEMKAVFEAPVPLAKFLWSISHTLRYSKYGHSSYLLGEVSRDGWWYFFPVVLAVKTPLPFLLLAIGGLWLSWKRGWPRGAPVAIAIVILLMCLPVRINLGARHILPLYPILAVLAGAALAALWRRSRLLAAAPVVWLAMNSIQAHPDYFAWFNELAGGRPERILGESDLDWGQDLTRLRDVLHVEGAQEVWLAYFGRADFEAHGLPKVRRLDQGLPPPGSWVAVSLHELLWDPSKYEWLKGIEGRPVGRSMRLFRVPASGALMGER